MTDKKPLSIIDLLGSIKVDQSVSPKVPKEYLSDEDYHLMQSGLNIVLKYKSVDWMSDLSEPEIQADLISLQCIVVQLAVRVGALSGFQDSEESRIKTTQAKVRLAIKKAKSEIESGQNGTLVKATAEDIKDASLASTEQLASKYEDMRTAATMLKYVFYAIKDHVTYLDKALQRMYQMLPQKLESQDPAYKNRNGKAPFSVSGSRED